MTAVVSAALADYRVREAESEKPSRGDLIAQTQGIWSRGDGLVWQKKMRAEWDR